MTKATAANSTGNISKEGNVTVALKEFASSIKEAMKPDAVKANKTVAVEANKTQDAKVIAQKKAVVADNSTKEAKLPE